MWVSIPTSLPLRVEYISCANEFAEPNVKIYKNLFKYIILVTEQAKNIEQIRVAPLPPPPPQPPPQMERFQIYKEAVLEGGNLGLGNDNHYIYWYLLSLLLILGCQLETIA